MTSTETAKPVLAIDVDGVLADYNGAFLPYMNRALKTSLTVEDIIKHNYDELAGVPADTIKAIMDDFEGQHGIVDLQPVQGAIESIKLLSQVYQTAVITSRRQHHLEATQQWLEIHGISMEVHMTNGMHNRMTHQAGRQTKAKVAQNINAIALIEDNENEIGNWAASNIEIVAYAQPWNKSLAHTHAHIPRLEWPDIVKKFLS